MENEIKLAYLNVLLSGMGVSLPESHQGDKEKENALIDAAKKVTGIRTNGKRSDLPLKSILSEIRKRDNIPKARFNIQKLNLEDDAVLPSLAPEKDKDFDEKLKRELEYVLKIEDADCRSYTAFTLAEAYGSRLAYENLESDGVSVFDYNRVLAGVIHCLGMGLKDKEISKQDSFPFYLIKGAVSGIQDFIYSMVNQERESPGKTKQLAKKLRGRSFYVALLTDFVAEYFCEELGLSRANMIFSGGGHFLIVAPRNEEIEQKIVSLDEDINLMLFRKLGPKLSFVTAAVPCEEGLEANKYYKKVNDLLEQKKLEKHKDYLEQLFFNEEKIERFVSDKKLGELLPKRDFLIQVKLKDFDVEDFTENTKIFKWLAASFHTLGTLFLLAQDESELQEILGLLNGISNVFQVRIIKINGTDFLENFEQTNGRFNFKIAYGFRFVGKYAPTNTEGVVPFEDLIEYRHPEKMPEKKRERQSSLSVMRLDVDNLGFLFGNGFGTEKSFVRLASLSREMHLFFGGYFNKIAEKFNIYVTYSGGDDAFVVGSWYNVILFAEELQNKFKKFACENPEVHFSAGIMTCNLHHPIARFAFETEDLLDIAKDFKQQKGDKKVVVKDAIRVFNHTYSWSRFHEMLKLGKKLEANTNNEGGKEKGKFSRSLIHRLLQIIQTGRDDEMVFYRNIGQLHYHLAKKRPSFPDGLTRVELDKNKDKPASELAEQLLKEFACKQTIVDYLLPTQFTLLKTRK